MDTSFEDQVLMVQQYHRHQGGSGSGRRRRHHSHSDSYNTSLDADDEDENDHFPSHNPTTKTVVVMDGRLLPKNSSSLSNSSMLGQGTIKIPLRDPSTPGRTALSSTTTSSSTATTTRTTTDLTADESLSDEATVSGSNGSNNSKRLTPPSMLLQGTDRVGCSSNSSSGGGSCSNSLEKAPSSHGPSTVSSSSGFGSDHHHHNFDYEAEAKKNGIQYTISHVPSVSLTILLGFQNALTLFGGLGLIPLTIVPLMGGTSHQSAELIGTIAVVTGLNTLIQTTFGNRLPIFQVPSFAYLPPTLSIIQHPQLQAIADPQERFIQTMQVLSGSVLVAGMVQAILGYSGAIVPILKYISPITISAVIITIGLGYYDVGFANVSTCFPMGLTMMILAVICSQYIKHMAGGSATSLGAGGAAGSLLLFISLFPLLVAMGFTWSLSAIFTAHDVWEEGSACRTDGANHIIEDMPFFRLPYPGQWGGLRFESYGVIPMFGAMMASMIESVGDYYSCARICGAPPPTPGIISRGLAAEGLGVMMTGMFGTGSGSTSSTGNIGVMALTGVGSRVVVQMASIILILVGVLGKAAATMAALPSGIIGGMFCVVLAVLVAVGMSNLQYITLNNHRNLFIVGFSIFYSLSIAGPGGYFTTTLADEDSKKSPFFDTAFGQIALALMSSPMVIALITSMIMDNTIPGTDEERGLCAWAHAQHADIHNDPQYVKVYSLPRFAANLFQNCGYLERFHRGTMPIPPANGEWEGGQGDLGDLILACFWGRRRKRRHHEQEEEDEDEAVALCMHDPDDDVDDDEVDAHAGHVA